MTETFRCRVEADLLREAGEVASDLGTTPGEVVRMTFRQLVRRRTIPFPIVADTLEDEVLSPAARRNALADEF